jgi:hypothetical protein
VDTVAHRERQVVEGVFWDYDCSWRESQRLGPDHHRPLNTEGSWGQGGRQRVQVGSATAPREFVQMARNNRAPVRGPPEDEVWGLRRWARYPPRDGRKEPRLGSQRPWRWNQLTWRDIGSERSRLPGRSCCALSRSWKKRTVNLNRRECPARLHLAFPPLPSRE